MILVQAHRQPAVQAARGVGRAETMPPSPPPSQRAAPSLSGRSRLVRSRLPLPRPACLGRQRPRRPGRGALPHPTHSEWRECPAAGVRPQTRGGEEHCVASAVRGQRGAPWLCLWAAGGAGLGGSGGTEGTTRVDVRLPWCPAASVSAHSPRQSRCSARQQRTSNSRPMQPDRKVSHMCHLLDSTSGLFLCHAGLAATTNPKSGCHGCHSVREWHLQRVACRDWGPSLARTAGSAS